MIRKLNGIYFQQHTLLNCSASSYYTAKTILTRMIITDVSLAADQHIIMISEGSCDTEDWSNDAENPVLTHRSKLQLKISKNNKEFF